MLARKLKNALVATAGAGALLLALGAGPAAALPVKFHFTDWEDHVDITAPGQTVQGLIRIDDIEIIGPGTHLYDFSPTGTQLVGYFFGATVTATPLLPGVLFDFTGGHVLLYYNSNCTATGCFNPNKAIVGDATGADVYQTGPGTEVGKGITDGDLALVLSFSSGLHSPPLHNAASTLAGGINGGGVDPFGTTVNIGGSGDAYLDVDYLFGGLGGGSWASLFDTNSPSLLGHDMSLANKFFELDSCPVGTGDPLTGGTGGAFACQQDGWRVTSSDPVVANIAQVPEAATLSMFGMGLFGLGFMARRRKAQKKG